MLFCKGKIPRLKLCKTCRVPFVPDADVSTDDLTAEGCGAWSCVQGLAAVKRHGQVCADGSLGGLTRIGVDAAGQIYGQHECAAFPLTIHQRTGSQPGRAKAAVKPGAIQSIHDGVKGLCCQRCRIAAFGDRQVCQACIPSIVTVRTFFIGKPSFDGFGKFSPKTKKRVPLSVPREQRVNALCMEKSVLHGFW